MARVKTIYDGSFIYYNEAGYTDRVDVTFIVSLFEYGIVRNPKNDKTIIGVKIDDAGNFTNFKWTYISLADIKEYLQEHAKDGYYSFIGSDKETELSNLSNDNLAIHIQSINSYDGWFRGD